MRALRGPLTTLVILTATLAGIFALVAILERTSLFVWLAICVGFGCFCFLIAEVVVTPWRRPHKVTKLDDGLQVHRNQAAINLLEQWADDESGYDERIWPQLKQAVEANRLSPRKRFDD